MSETTARTLILSLSLIFALKIVCFVLAYLTIRMGYLLLASGAKGEFKFSGNFGGVTADLASASPGLLFVLLAVLLAAYAIGVSKVATVDERSGPSHVAAPGGPLPPPPATDVSTR